MHATTRTWPALALTLALAAAAACKSDPAPAVPSTAAAGLDASAAVIDASAGAVATAAEDGGAGSGGAGSGSAGSGSAASADAPAAEIAPVPSGEARVALIHDGELLRSEQGGLDRVKRALQRGRPVATLGDATDEEAAMARAYLADAPPASPPPLPVAWRDAPVVIVLELLPPIGRKPKRLSGGLAGMVVFRPPAVAPILVRKVPATMTSGLTDDSLPAWIATTIQLVAAAGSPP